MSRNDTHSVRFKNDLWKKLQVQAKREDRSVTSLVHHAVQVYLALKAERAHWESTAR